MKSKVYFTSLRTHAGMNLLDKMERLIQSAGIENINFNNKFTAIKIHFGEAGNLAYVRPNYAARLGKILKQLGAKPFLTDANTLYKGSRGNAIDHLYCASDNGFNLLSAKMPVIIADGLKGTECRQVAVSGAAYCKSAKIGSAIADADVVISFSHFKGHEQAGFGGALKNLGMGSASVAGKLELHSGAQPEVTASECTSCRVCEKNCAHDAIRVINRAAVIDYDACVGCGQCVALCQFAAVAASTEESIERLTYKIADYTKAVIQDKPHFHINFIINVSPDCDCWGHNDAAIVPDIGIACSFDPVALDQASAELVMGQPIVTNNALSDKHGHDHLIGKDKFKHLHPDTNWQAGLRYAEGIGIGKTDYELITI